MDRLDNAAFSKSHPVPVTFLTTGTHISVGEVPVRPLSVGHHLPHHHSITPHVAGRGELAVGDGFGGCPADRDLSALPCRKLLFNKLCFKSREWNNNQLHIIALKNCMMRYLFDEVIHILS